jgi:hypothetical protein
MSTSEVAETKQQTSFEKFLALVNSPEVEMTIDDLEIGQIYIDKEAKVWLIIQKTSKALFSIDCAKLLANYWHGDERASEIFECLRLTAIKNGKIEYFDGTFSRVIVNPALAKAISDKLRALRAFTIPLADFCKNVYTKESEDDAAYKSDISDTDEDEA